MNLSDDGKIFKQGTEVEIVEFPSGKFANNLSKLEWGKQALRACVAKHYGHINARYSVMPRLNRNGRLTGSSAVFIDSKLNQRITFMVVEPIDNLSKRISILKMVESLNEGDSLDVMDHEFSTEGIKARKAVTHHPFANLAEKLIEKGIEIK